MKRSTVLIPLLLGVAGACSGGGLVGGECKPGACEGAASAGASGSDAEADVAATGDAGEAAAPDGGAGDAPAPLADGGDAPLDASSPGDAAPADAELSDGGAEADVQPIACEEPLVLCDGVCLDVSSDPENCGGCGVACPSGICAGGNCVGATKGHVVLLCASYEQSFQSSPGTALLGNAVFLPSSNPVRVLGWVEHTPTIIKNRINQTVQWAATAKGRTYGIASTTSAAEVAAKLDPSLFDVLLVYDQPNAPAGVLGQVGSAWAPKIASFVAAGGVVVVASGGGGQGEMHDLVSNAGLSSVSGQAPVTGSILENSAPADAVGLNVLSPFVALKQSCTWQTSSSEGPGNVFVIRVAGSDAGPGGPVVIHRAF